MTRLLNDALPVALTELPAPAVAVNVLVAPLIMLKEALPPELSTSKLPPNVAVPPKLCEPDV